MNILLLFQTLQPHWLPGYYSITLSLLQPQEFGTWISLSWNVLSPDSHIQFFPLFFQISSNLTLSEKQFLFIRIKRHPFCLEPMLIPCLISLCNTCRHLSYYIFVIHLFNSNGKCYISWYLLTTDWIFSSISSGISFGWKAPNVLKQCLDFVSSTVDLLLKGSSHKQWEGWELMILSLK